MVQLRDDVVGLDAAILGPPAVWEASGHLATFTDPLVDCKNCHERWRADKIEGVCPNCGSHDLTEARAFNLMFKTHAGPVEDEGHVAYLRPETAQGMFTNFANVLGTTRKKPPFGIAQVGKSFRNEITPQNFVFRTREFEQMEMEYFVPPDEEPEVVRLLAVRAHALVPRPGHPGREAAPAPSRAERAVALLTRHGRRRVPLPLGLGRARGHRQPGRLRPHRPRPGVGRVARLLRPADQRALHAARHRAGGRRHPDHDGLPARCLQRGRGRRRGPHGAAPALAAGALPGGGAAAVEEGHARAAGPPGAGRPAAALHVRLRHHPEHRPALPAPGRGGDAVVRDRRLRLARGRRGHRARPGHDRAGARSPIADLVGELRRRTGEG